MVIIEGAPGVGKTTLQRKLCDNLYKAHSVIQDYEHNVCLADYYNGMDTIFQKQMIFLFSDYHILKKNLSKHHDKILISDFSMERSEIMAKHCLSEYEYLFLFLPCYNYLLNKLQLRHKLLILLYADPKYIMNNIKKRNREIEQDIQIEYISDKQKIIIEELPEKEFEKIIKIDCTRYSILDEKIVDTLSQEILHFENTYGET